MSYKDCYDRYANLLKSLAVIVETSNKRVLSEPPDILLSENVNFFVKTYLITICTYLEAYLKEVAILYYEEINTRLIAAQLPHNFLYKNIQKSDFKNLKFEDANFSLGKEEFVSNISGNVDKTIRLFATLGLNLKNSTEFNRNKVLIGAIVDKRNNIIHNNDNAAETSFQDILTYIESFDEYMKIINLFVTNLKN